MARVCLYAAFLTCLALVVEACGDQPAHQRVAASGTRPATPAELAKIAPSVREIGYVSDPPVSSPPHYGLDPREPRLQPKVVLARVSRIDPRFAGAVVEMRDPSGRQRGPAAVLVLEKADGHSGWDDVVAGPALDFRLSCTRATPRAVRSLLCADPWHIFGYPRPPQHAQTKLVQRIPSADLHALDWSKVALPGGVCGSSRAIRRRTYRGEGIPIAYIHPDVEFLGWRPVHVFTWSKPRFGDIDGDGHDEAVVRVMCHTNGTASSALRYSAVVFKAAGKTLRVLGILTPRQPPTAEPVNVPIVNATAIRRGEMISWEAWYGPLDYISCGTGTARTIWTYRGGKLRPRTDVLEKPLRGSLHILYPYVDAEPGDRELERFGVTRVVATRDVGLGLTIWNDGHTPKRDVQVRLTIAQSPRPIVRTTTIDQIDPDHPDEPHPARVVFRNFGRLPLGRETKVTVTIERPETRSVSYYVIFTRR